MASNITSQVTILNSITRVGYALFWTGTTPVGAASIEVSNDYQAQGATVLNAGTWTALTLSVSGTTVASVAITGNTGTAFIDVQNISAYAIRLIYTAVSGTGTIQAVINGKVS